MSTVGFLSLVSEDESPTARKRKKLSNSRLFGREQKRAEEDTLQHGDKFEPLMAYEGFLERKSATGWKSFWAECNLSGYLILKRKEDDQKPYKEYKLKYCSLIKSKDRCFTLLRPEKSNTMFRTETMAQCSIWVPTLSQYSSEMYTALRISDWNIPTLVWNGRGIIISLNHAAGQLLGYAEEFLIGKNIVSIIPADKCTTNEIIWETTQHQSDNPVDSHSMLSSTVTMVPNKYDDIYMLYCFGCYQEFEKERYLLSFSETSASEQPISKACRCLESDRISFQGKCTVM